MLLIVTVCILTMAAGKMDQFEQQLKNIGKPLEYRTVDNEVKVTFVIVVADFDSNSISNIVRIIKFLICFSALTFCTIKVTICIINWFFT